MNATDSRELFASIAAGDHQPLAQLHCDSDILRVSASPSGPVQLHCWCGCVLGQSGEQPADLVAGQRDQRVAGRVALGVRGCGEDGQEGAGEQGQDGPAVPGGPVADLVLVQAGQFLPGGEPVLNRPPLMPLKWERSLA
jgi:hypothetical protein